MLLFQVMGIEQEEENRPEKKKKDPCPHGVSVLEVWGRARVRRGK